MGYLAVAETSVVWVESRTLAMTGQRSDRQVSLTVDFGFGIRQTWNGTQRGNELILDVPQDDGTLQPMRFTKGDAESFNARWSDSTPMRSAEIDSAADAVADAANGHREALKTWPLPAVLSFHPIRRCPERTPVCVVARRDQPDGSRPGLH
jgi:hypothetical protein